MVLCEIEKTTDISEHEELESINYEKIHETIDTLQRFGMIHVEEIEKPIYDDLKCCIADKSIYMATNIPDISGKKQYHWDIATYFGYIDYITNAFKHILPAKRTFVRDNNDILRMEDEKNIYVLDIYKYDIPFPAAEYTTEGNISQTSGIVNNIKEIINIPEFRLTYRNTVLVPETKDLCKLQKYGDIQVEYGTHIDQYLINLLALLTTISLREEMELNTAKVNTPSGCINNAKKIYRENGFFTKQGSNRVFVREDSKLQIIMNDVEDKSITFYLKVQNPAQVLAFLFSHPDRIKCQCGDNHMPEIVFPASLNKKDRYILNISE